VLVACKWFCENQAKQENKDAIFSGTNLGQVSASMIDYLYVSKNIF